MRKLLLVLLAFMLAFGGVAFAYTASVSVGEADVRTQVKEAQGGLPTQGVYVYQLVRYAEQGNNALSLSPDTAVVWDTVSDDGVSVRMTATSGDAAIAGIIASTITTADTADTASGDSGKSNFGYMLIRGISNVIIQPGGTTGSVGGDVWIMSGDSGSAAQLVDATAGGVVSAAANRAESLAAASKGGIFLDAPSSTSATRQKVMVLLE